MQALQMHDILTDPPQLLHKQVVWTEQEESAKTQTQYAHRDGLEPQNGGSSASPKLEQGKREGKMFDCLDPET